MLTNAFSYLSDYIWGLWVIFMETLLFIIFFRILFSFIIRVFKLDINYNSFSNKIRTYNQHNALDNLNKRDFHS